MSLPWPNWSEEEWKRRLAGDKPEPPELPAPVMDWRTLKRDVAPPDDAE